MLLLVGIVSLLFGGVGAFLSFAWFVRAWSLSQGSDVLRFVRIAAEPEPRPGNPETGLTSSRIARHPLS
jgi:hypothetical protein